MASNMYGISALDPRIAATDKFIQEKQIPPNQVEDFLLGMGADPRLASLVFKYRKVREAAEKQPKGPPANSNVAQDVSNQYAQMKQQERMQRGVAAMPAPVIANARMQGGITGEPMPRMAGGGIVAFDNGGDVDSDNQPASNKGSWWRRALRNPLLRRAGYVGAGLGAIGAMLGDEEAPPEGAAAASVEEVPEGISDEQVAILAKLDEEKASQAAKPTGSGLTAAPTFKRPDLTPFTEAIAEAEKRVPKDREAALAEEMAREEQLGETKAIEARGKELKAQREKATMSPEKRFWLSFAQAGFAASAKGARNLWETLSMGGIEGMKAYETMKEKEAATLEKIADKELQLISMSAAINRGAMERSDKRLDEARREYQTLQLQHAAQLSAITNAENAFGAQIYGIRASQEGADRRAAAALAGRRGKDTLVQQYYDDIAKAQRATDPKIKAALLARAKDTKRAIAELEQTESGFQSQEARLRASQALMPQSGVGDGFGDVAVE